MTLGDSKTALNWPNAWPGLLKSSLESTVDSVYLSPEAAWSGYTVSQLKDYVPTVTDLYPASVIPDFILVNVGSNDAKTPMTAEATFKADLATMLDALHTKWPNAEILVDHIFRTSFVEAGACATINTWIDAVLASRLDWTSPGLDETVWAENGDNGVTMLSDGAHYSAAGQAKKAELLPAAMGY